MKSFPLPLDATWRVSAVWLFSTVVLAQWCGAHPTDEAGPVESGASILATTLLNEHPYLVEPQYRQGLQNRLQEFEESESESDLGMRLARVLATVESTIAFGLDEAAESGPPKLDRIELPGDRGGILFKVSNGEGPVDFKTSKVDLSLTEGWVTLPVASSGTTWSLLSLRNVPDGVTTLFASIEGENGSVGAFQFQVTAPATGRLRLHILSDDSGEPTPAMLQLRWLRDGSYRRPDNALDFTPQFDSQASDRYGAAGGRRLSLPGRPVGDYWVVPGPVDMDLPPGRWQISLLRGLEHIPLTDAVQVVSGETVEKTYRPERWVDMAARGWYSGDDHVHVRITSRSDADNLMTWARAEDMRVVNVLEMGDHARTYFQLSAFGPEGRIMDSDTMIVPGQEDPRISQLGHTIALNIREPVRDTSRYYLHDWFHERVHEVGGLFGYAHVNSGIFNVHRDMTLNVPLGKVDFVELLQFHNLGTELYYDFLNLGFKITASAGSDVPWGATIGEVRVYALVEEGGTGGDAWFDAVEQGRTFVTNGPMLEFSIDGALPGDEIKLTDAAASLKVRARAWGHPDRLTPTKLEIVRQGEVIQAVTEAERSDDGLELTFDLKAGSGGWVAARATADDGSVAHTTPIYLSRPPLRFWDHEQVPTLIDRRLESLQEIEQLIDENRLLGKVDAAEGPLLGALAGSWYGNADLTRPQGIDTLHLPTQKWPGASQRGGVWSAQWTGALTLPNDVPGVIEFHLDSSGPSTLELNGQPVIDKIAPGLESATIELVPGSVNEVHLSYVNLRASSRYLSLHWSADGVDRQPVPAEWFSLREKDRAAFRYTRGAGIEEIQLREQTEELLKRVAAARLTYEGLRTLWREELPLRQP